MKRIYLDHAATTPMDARVKKAMEPYWSKIFGNPSSLHREGLDARVAVDSARRKVAEILGCEIGEIIFTNGGTESDNMAIFGVARAHTDERRHVITTQIEHHAVLEPFEMLEKEGYATTYLAPDKEGIVRPETLERATTKETIFVSVMYANNEIGTVQPITELAKTIRSKEKEFGTRIYFHTDACQAASYCDLDVRVLGADLLTLNGGKIYGPKATGALYIKKGTDLEPLLYGGGQERNMRVGTENVPGIVGFAEALKIAEGEKKSEGKRLSALRDYLIAGILRSVKKSFLNGHPKKRLPNNVNVSILDIEGEALILRLDHAGIAVSTGSACSSRNLEPSHVLRALGLPYEAAHGSLRITLGRGSTKQEADYLLNILPKIVADLRELSPLNLRKKRFK